MCLDRKKKPLKKTRIKLYNTLALRELIDDSELGLLKQGTLEEYQQQRRST
jgi:hypothetical protein